MRMTTVGVASDASGVIGEGAVAEATAGVTVEGVETWADMEPPGAVVEGGTTVAAGADTTLVVRQEGVVGCTAVAEIMEAGEGPEAAVDVAQAAGALDHRGVGGVLIGIPIGLFRGRARPRHGRLPSTVLTTPQTMMRVVIGSKMSSTSSMGTSSWMMGWTPTKMTASTYFTVSLRY